MSIDEYYKISDKNKIKKYGQFFTSKSIAKFMVNWATNVNYKVILDPAVGNGIFLKNVPNDKTKIGYDIDFEIINYFANEGNINYKVNISDYLLDWNLKADVIICNPPYNRFQNIDNRKEITLLFKDKMNLDISGYTNQCILFMLKSIFELNEGGRIAYIIPKEFMDLEYGNIVKDILIKERCLDSIIVFKDSENIFDKAITTSCIVLIEKKKHQNVKFYSINSSELDNLSSLDSIEISYDDLIANKKWKFYFEQEQGFNELLVPFKKYAKVVRGIATGDNDYFLFSKTMINSHKLSENNFIQCITKSSMIKNLIFTDNEFQALSNLDKKVYLFDGSLYMDEFTKKYIELGIKNRITDKFLVASRKPWYKSEKKDIAPIWICGNSRDKIKVIRNLTFSKNLTTFHGIYINENYQKYTNILFCYLISDLGQKNLFVNKREYAGGLNKFQPNDINNSLVLDFEVLSDEDLKNIEDCYNLLVNSNCSKYVIEKLNDIFKKYI